jgi:hypothetical protein
MPHPVAQQAVLLQLQQGGERPGAFCQPLNISKEQLL